METVAVAVDRYVSISIVNRCLKNESVVVGSRWCLRGVERVRNLLGKLLSVQGAKKRLDSECG